MDDDKIKDKIYKRDQEDATACLVKLEIDKVIPHDKQVGQEAHDREDVLLDPNAFIDVSDGKGYEIQETEENNRDDETQDNAQDVRIFIQHEGSISLFRL
jgi:hypothetical protein